MISRQSDDEDVDVAGLEVDSLDDDELDALDDELVSLDDELESLDDEDFSELLDELEDSDDDPGGVLAWDPRLSVLKNPEPLNVTPTG